MAKNIIVCSDGTGNTAIKGRGTNVFKLFEAVDLNGHRSDATLVPQVALYDDGVGTENFKPLKIIAGAAGFGLGRNVRQLYKELARIYDPGDHIFMFGFSRGAFTVRSLTGMIATCGLIDASKAPTARALDRLVNQAYAAYRACYRTTLGRVLRGPSSKEVGENFRRDHAREPKTLIRFLGVWDTVDAVGLPFHLSDIINSTLYRFKFPDHYLSDIVVQACHALSVDDERHSFHPLVWNEGRGGERIEQVWFSGVHSNVGGGYPKQGMSLVALDWMMAKAEAAGLRLNRVDRESFRDHSSVDDKLYDPRAGLGTFYRWKPRDIEEICRRNSIGEVRIHTSVLERIAHSTEDYAPANLAPSITVVSTPPTTELLSQRAANLQHVFNAALGGRSLLAGLRAPILLGRASYYVFLIAGTLTVLAAIAFTAEQRSILGFGLSAMRLIGGIVSSPLATLFEAWRALWTHPLTFWSIAIALAASSLMSRIADTKINDVSSQFWHEHRPELRQALKDARAAVTLSGRSGPRLSGNKGDARPFMRRPT
jgi:uncharacterized protein (DUF2235 family)